MWHVAGIDYLQKSAVLKESDLIKGLLMRFTGAVEAEGLLWTVYLVHKRYSFF